MPARRDAGPPADAADPTQQGPAPFESRGGLVFPRETVRNSMWYAIVRQHDPTKEWAC